MGSNITNNRDMRGFLLPWPIKQADIWTAQSAYTQQTAIAGTPQASGDYALGLQTAGTQTSELNIKSTKAGSPKKGAFVWKHSADTLWYGSDEDGIITGFEVAATANPTTERFEILDSLGTSDGYAYVLTRYFDGGSGYNAILYVRDKNGLYTPKILGLINGTYYAQVYGALCVAEDGSLLAAYYDIDASASAQLVVFRSTNQGANWTKISSAALPTALDLTGAPGAGAGGYDLSKMRMRAANGQILLICGLLAHNTTPAVTDVVAQYVSVDGGCTFAHIYTDDGAANHFYMPELVVSNNQFLLIYIEDTQIIRCVRLPNAFSNIKTVRSLGSVYVTQVSSLNVVAGGLTNKHWTQGQLSCWEDPAGKIYCAMENVGSNGRLFMAISEDSGATWNFTGGGGTGGTALAGTAKIYDANDADATLINFSGCKLGAGSLLFCNADTNSTLNEGSLSVVYLGGYTTVTTPGVVAFADYWQRVRWDITWLPIETPDQLIGTVFTSTGAGSATLQSGNVRIATTAQNKFWTPVAGVMSGNNLTTGTIVRAGVRVISGGSLTTGDIGFTIRISDTAANYVDLQVNLTSTAIRLEQNTTVIAELSIATTTPGVDIICAMANGKVSAWARVRSFAEKTWSTIANGVAVATTAGATTPFVQWGHVASATATSEWYEFHFVSGANTGTQMAQGLNNPNDLYARTYPPRSFYTYVDDGLYLSTYDGPAREGDEYTIPVRYQYGIENIFNDVSPTPQITWRGAAVASGACAAEFIALHMDSTIGSSGESEFGSQLIGVYLANINFKDFTVERYDTGAGWQVMATVANEKGIFTFGRNGATIKKTAGATGPYFTLNEMAGWRVKLDPGGAGSAVYRTIRTNSEGVLSTKTTKQCVIMLADAQPTDPTTGTATIIPNSCTVVIDTQGETASAWGVRISAQETPEKFIQVGALAIGRIAVFGKQYSRGRELTFTPAVEVYDQSDNIQRTRDVGTGYRTVQLAWTEGIDTSEFFMADPDPDYWQATTGGGAIAANNDVPYFLMGMVKYTNGAQTPMVYLPKIYPQAGTVWIMNRRHDHIYVTMNDDISIENVLGSELSNVANSGEVFRVSTVSFRELI